MGFPDIVGLIGVVLILIAYYLLEIDKIGRETLSYPMLNFVGAVLILFSLLYEFNLPAVMMELSWVAVSLMGIRRVLKQEKTKK